ncbi:MAG: TetR/AcrR family transcriptional regulator [Gammaproteobacteria bacterium]|jgi:TetR/AcrR family transcriptional regulator
MIDNVKVSSQPIDVTAAPRRRQARSEVTRLKLLEAALREFAAHGFEATSTRAIATAAETQQPQINYHFSSKEALWQAAVDHLFERLDDVVRRRVKASPPVTDERSLFGQQVRGFVHAAAELPELNRIMVHEATVVSDRLRWLVERHTRPRFEALTRSWRALRLQGLVADIDETVFYYSLVGAASLPYVNAPEALLLGHDTLHPAFIELQADALVALFLGPDGVTR